MKGQATFQSDTFCDFDQYAAAVGHADLCLTMSRMKRPQWTMRHIGLADSIDIQMVDEGGSSLASGAVRDDGFVLFLSEASDFSANGRLLNQDAVFLIPAGKEFCLTIDHPHRWTSVFVPFASVDAADIMMPDSRTIGTSARIVHPRNGVAKRVRSCVTRFVAGAQAEPSVLQHTVSVRSFHEALTGCLKNCLVADGTKSERRPGRPRTVDHKLIAKAVELIEDSPETTATVSGLVAALDVSERSVQTGFQRFLGVSPQRFIALRRLHRARRRLMAGSLPDTTVTRVAAEVGIWDFGRFAQRYAKLFGEKPSETLKRRERR